MPIHVVAAAIIRDGRVLAAHRVGGNVGWEFPGGKVEDGETEVQALTRECAEELGVAVRVDERLGEAANEAIRVVLYEATVISAEPAAGADHDEVQWIGPDELDGVDWLPVDRDLLPLVAPLLQDLAER